MKTRFDEIGYPLYCDAGPHEGDTRIDLTIRLYLSPQEYARYEGPESLRITLGDPGSEPVPEPAGELLDRPRNGGRRRPARGPSPARAPVRFRRSTAKEHRDGRP